METNVREAVLYLNPLKTVVKTELRQHRTKK